MAEEKVFFASEKVEWPTILLFSHSVSTSPSSKSYHGGMNIDTRPEYVRVCVFVAEIAWWARTILILFWILVVHNQFLICIRLKADKHAQSCDSRIQCM